MILYRGRTFFPGFIIPLLLVFLLVFLLGTTSSHARGRAVIKSDITTGWQRESNFYKSESNTRTIDTYHVKPGVKLGYTTDKSLASLDYWFKILQYDDQDDTPAGEVKADDFNYTEHRAKFTTQTQPTDRLLLGIDNLYWKTRDSANSQANSNVVDRYKYTMNRLTPRLAYNFGEKFGIDLSYSNQVLDYLDDDPGEGEDANENRGRFILIYNFNQRTSFDLNCQYWNMDYDKTTSDYNSSQVMVNVNRQFNYFTFAAGMGYHTRDFDQTTTTGDIEKMVWKLSLTGQNPPDAEGIPRSSIYLALGSNLNDIGSGGSYYTSTRLDAAMSRLFAEKINCTIRGWYQNSEYEGSDRTDDRWTISGAVDYLINHLFTIGFEGGMERRDSNEVGRDFDNHYLMLNAKFAYNPGSR